MAKTIFIRPTRLQDKDQCLEWIQNTEGNVYDLGVFLYPTTYTRCAFNSKGPIAYLPVQKPLMVEALAVNPEADKLEVAMALKELIQDTVSQAYQQGAGEVYFTCIPGSSTAKFAEAHGFEEIKMSVYRMKLSDLEKIDENNVPPVVQ